MEFIKDHLIFWSCFPNLMYFNDLQELGTKLTTKFDFCSSSKTDDSWTLGSNELLPNGNGITSESIL